MLKNAKGIRSLFNTLILSIYPAANISVLLGLLVTLLYALYAILGMQVFGHSLMQDPECAMNPESRVHQVYYEDASNTEAGVWTPSFAGHSAVKDSGTTLKDYGIATLAWMAQPRAASTHARRKPVDLERTLAMRTSTPLQRLAR